VKRNGFQVFDGSSRGEGDDVMELLTLPMASSRMVAMMLRGSGRAVRCSVCRGGNGRRKFGVLRRG